ncbi:hypothetical protein DFA_04398 [Cavenderia fasciculata]|uniref:Uncharacterized protein n=1 Tax=Cavenderia fasciculata TaxID=261658 RepID=F4PPG7_CACFS|nr:uncharacterized protein DFA_04398 [Cavenderia fasciculata]EGG22280.1 hypothetical protein DFA_04398 [Cavenderia fasciculata]|eukprot:XP_004360131.1 hypothetical protein DFA_04398 [Cavenderia fasciculata]
MALAQAKEPKQIDHPNSISIYIRQLIFNHILRRRVISQYCCHQNATLDTLNHLFEWSQVDFDLDYLKALITYFKRTLDDIKNQEILSIEETETNDFLSCAINMACKYGYLSTVKLICSFKYVHFKHIAMQKACIMDSLTLIDSSIWTRIILKSLYLTLPICIIYPQFSLKSILVASIPSIIGKLFDVFAKNSNQKDGYCSLLSMSKGYTRF